MSKFALREIKSIKGKYKFYELKVGKEYQLETFHEKIEKKYSSELISILAYMDFVANLKSLPETKFKDITPDKEVVKEYEFKSKHLRIYCIKLKKEGKVIIFCGYKNTQPKDIKKFRSLKKEYLKSKKDDK